MLQGYKLSVESSTVEIVSIEDNGTSISIDIGLIQENTYNEGDTLDITLDFTLEEITLGIYSASNPINVNDATAAELMSIGLTEYQATRVVDVTAIYPATSLEHLDTLTGLNTFVTNYQQYEDMGIIVFN
jgi:hypothetical protein